MSHYQIDARRLLCPMPVIKLQNKIKELQAEDTIEIACTDPGALQDIPAWCRIHGHELIGNYQQNLDIILVVRIKDTAA